MCGYERLKVCFSDKVFAAGIVHNDIFTRRQVEFRYKFDGSSHGFFGVAVEEYGILIKEGHDLLVINDYVISSSLILKRYRKLLFNAIDVIGNIAVKTGYGNLLVFHRHIFFQIVDGAVVSRNLENYFQNTAVQTQVAPHYKVGNGFFLDNYGRKFCVQNSYVNFCGFTFISYGHFTVTFGFVVFGIIEHIGGDRRITFRPVFVKNGNIFFRHHAFVFIVSGQEQIPPCGSFAQYRQSLINGIGRRVSVGFVNYARDGDFFFFHRYFEFTINRIVNSAEFAVYESGMVKTDYLVAYPAERYYVAL